MVSGRSEVLYTHSIHCRRAVPLVSATSFGRLALSLTASMFFSVSWWTRRDLVFQNAALLCVWHEVFIFPTPWSFFPPLHWKLTWKYICSSVHANRMALPPPFVSHINMFQIECDCSLVMALYARTLYMALDMKRWNYVIIYTLKKKFRNT